MTRLKALRQNWEYLGKDDPLWAVCTDPEKTKRRWDTKEFFATGEAEIQTVFDYLSGLGLNPDQKGIALDFGCGPGRLTRSLSMRFQTCYGVDISSTMIEAAKRFNEDKLNCHFVVNDTDRLAQFANGSFDFIYSSIVLQHIEPKYVISYLRDFARLLKPSGTLVFQMPSHRKVWMGGLRERLQIKAKLQQLFAAVGVAGTDPRKSILMHCLSERIIRKVLLSLGFRIADVRITNSCESDFNGNLQYMNREPDVGYVSKQYVATRDARCSHVGEPA